MAPMAPMAPATPQATGYDIAKTEVRMTTFTTNPAAAVSVVQI